jgi:putative tryptophan/tyrosine transport system substrate-binding protein
MRRRQFIAGFAGAAVGLPMTLPAQQAERVRRIGVLLPAAADDFQYQTFVGAFLQELGRLGWMIGRNVQTDIRWAGVSVDDIRKHAAELVSSAPDVILANGNEVVRALLQPRRTAPVVFVAVADPVGAGFVDGLARPGGNATGFMTFEFSVGGKWLELLKHIAPAVTRVAILRDSATSTGIGQFGVIQAVAPSLGVAVTPMNVRDAGEIERAVAAFAQSPNGGLIVAAGGSAIVHRDLIVKLASRHKLPAVYFNRVFVAAGGLISYGASVIDQYRQATGYIDRILKGEKLADLPVQGPAKYETVLNLKSAKALGLDVPVTVAARADEVIELARRPQAGAIQLVQVRPASEPTRIGFACCRPKGRYPISSMMSSFGIATVRCMTSFMRPCRCAASNERAGSPTGSRRRSAHRKGGAIW